MAGIGPALPPSGSTPLSKTHKDGGGSGGGSYYPQRRQKEEEGDEAEISPEALKRLAEEKEHEAKSTVPAHVQPQAAAKAQPEANSARLEILSEIQSFNELHERLKSKLHARLTPIPGGSALLVEDNERGVALKPFGERDIFHYSFQEVRTKLQAFDKSAGSHFDGVV